MTDAAARLAALREQHLPAVQSLTERGWESADDAWDELGPMGIAEWGAGGTARQVLSLVDIVEAVLEAKPSMHGDQHPIPGACRFCEGEAAGLAKIHELIGNHLAVATEEATDR